MRKKWLSVGMLTLVVLLALAMPVLADGGGNGTVQFGEDLIVARGERLRGDAVVFGANALVEPGGLIAGDLVVMGGSADIGGEVLGSVVVFGGNVALKDGSMVAGDALCFGGILEQDPGAHVKGQTLSGLQWPPSLEKIWHLVPLQEGEVWHLAPLREGPQPLHWSNMAIGGIAAVFRGILGALVTALLMAGLAILTILLVPRQTEQVMQCLETAWPASLGIGILALICLVAVSLILIFTCCLAPVGLLLLLAGAVAWIFGLIAAGAIVGERLFEGLKAGETAPLVTAAVGTGLIILLSNTPCVGWLIGLAAGIMGLGAVCLTRFGTRPYVPATTAASSPPEALPLEPPEEEE